MIQMILAKFRGALLTTSLVAGLTLPAFAQIPGTPSERVFPKPPYSPYAGRNYPTRPYFGDQHLHTAFSMDAGAFGAPELIAVWTDPDFDAAERAFYYARVIEVPTPRWTAYDAKRFGVTPLPGTRMTVTERAYTSPIWYMP